MTESGSPDCNLQMILHGGEPAGLLRLNRRTRDGSNAWEIAILIAPDRTKLGISAAALMLGRSLLPDAELVAEVLPDDDALHALLAAVGYKRCADGLYRSLPMPD